ncbi:type IV pilus minor pilin PilW [Geobacter sp. AOG1]|nr:type IV pilus minor pilin PilW [Geobacter sp. AOG1]
MKLLLGEISDKGYSIVEVLIVIVILGLVTTGLTVTFITGQREYSERDTTIRMQQQARLAMSFMERDIKMAGSGLANLGNLKINVYTGTPTITTWGMVQWGDGGSGGPDSITILYQNPTSPTDEEKGGEKPAQVTLSADYPSSKPNNLLVSSSTLTTDYKESDLFLIYNPEDQTRPASLLQVSNVPAPGNWISHASGTKYPYNPPNATELFPAGGYKKRGSTVLSLSANDIKRVTYFLDGDKLVRNEWSSTTKQTQRHFVATGIEDLQVRYQFKDGTWRDDMDSSTGSSHDVKDVRGARISIIARTAKPDPRYQSTQAFQLTGPLGNGKVYSGGGYRRMTMSTMVSLRNLAMRNTP